MSRDRGAPSARVCPSALGEFAGALRPDWDSHAISGAITGCLTSGWLWPKVVVGMIRTALDPDGQPYDLPRAVLQIGPPDLLTRPPPPASPQERDRYLREIRNQLPAPSEGQQELPIVDKEQEEDP